MTTNLFSSKENILEINRKNFGARWGQNYTVFRNVCFNTYIARVVAYSGNIGRKVFLR